MLRRVVTLPVSYPIVDNVAQRTHPLITRFTVGLIPRPWSHGLEHSWQTWRSCGEDCSRNISPGENNDGCCSRNQHRRRATSPQPQGKTGLNLTFLRGLFPDFLPFCTVSYVSHSSLSVSYEAFRRPCGGVPVMLLITRFTVRKQKEEVILSSGYSGFRPV